MTVTRFPLGVPLMDDDHASIEAMLATAADAPDDCLQGQLWACRTEIAAHFRREEALMRERGVPVLACHVAQHARLIEDIDSVLAAPALPDRLRTYLARDLPNLVMAHIASVDQVSARFINGDLPAGMVDALRLGEGGSR